MKKLLVLLITLAMMGGFVMAEDIGLTAGLEFGIIDVNKPNNADDTGPYLYPNIIYDNAFLDSALGLYAELGYGVGFTKGFDYAGFGGVNKDGDKVNPMWLYFDLGITYNLFLNEASTLSFILENEIDPLSISPRFDKTSYDADKNAINMISIFEPAVNFNQKMDGVGDIYANAQFRITYLQDDTDKTPLHLRGKIGWNSEFGLGLWIREDLALNEIDGFQKSGHAQFNFLISYETGPFYAEVETNIPKDFNKVGGGGMTIKPKVQYTIFDGLNVWLKCGIGSIGAKYINATGDEKSSDAAITPSLGVTYSF